MLYVFFAFFRMLYAIDVVCKLPQKKTDMLVNETIHLVVSKLFRFSHRMEGQALVTLAGKTELMISG